MPATILPASRTKIASSTASPSPMAADASRRICASRNSRSSGSGSSSTRKSTAAASSGVHQLFEQRDVVEIRPERPDLALAEVRHRGAGQLDAPPGRLEHGAVAEDVWPCVIGLDDPFR